MSVVLPYNATLLYFIFSLLIYIFFLSTSISLIYLSFVSLLSSPLSTHLHTHIAHISSVAQNHIWFFIVRVGLTYSSPNLRACSHLRIQCGRSQSVDALASRSPCWIVLAPSRYNRTGRAGESSSSGFALSSCLGYVGLVRVSSLRIYREGSALVSWFQFDFSLQLTFHWHEGLDKSGTCSLVAECTYIGRS